MFRRFIRLSSSNRLAVQISIYSNFVNWDTGVCERESPAPPPFQGTIVCVKNEISVGLFPRALNVSPNGFRIGSGDALIE